MVVHRIAGHANGGARGPPEVTPDDALRRFVWPIKPRDFMRDIYRKRALVVHGPVSRLSAIAKDHLYDLDLEQMLENTASDKIHVWMRTGQDGAIETIHLDDAEQAMVCHRAGASLYFRSSQEAADALVSAFNHDVGINFAGLYPDGAVKGEIEMFVSRQGHATDWHFDFMENFTFQLR